MYIKNRHCKCSAYFFVQQLLVWFIFYYIRLRLRHRIPCKQCCKLKFFRKAFRKEQAIQGSFVNSELLLCIKLSLPFKGGGPRQRWKVSLS